VCSTFGGCPGEGFGFWVLGSGFRVWTTTSTLGSATCHVPVRRERVLLQQNMAHIRQSSPDSGLGVQTKILLVLAFRQRSKPFQSFPLRSGTAGESRPRRQSWGGQRATCPRTASTGAAKNRSTRPLRPPPRLWPLRRDQLSAVHLVWSTWP